MVEIKTTIEREIKAGDLVVVMRGKEVKDIKCEPVGSYHNDATAWDVLKLVLNDRLEFNGLIKTIKEYMGLAIVDREGV